MPLVGLIPKIYDASCDILFQTTVVQTRPFSFENSPLAAGCLNIILVDKVLASRLTNPGGGGFQPALRESSINFTLNVPYITSLLVIREL